MKRLTLIILLLTTFSAYSQHELVNSVCFNSTGDDYAVRFVNDLIYFISDKSDSIVGSRKDRTTGKYFTDVYEVHKCERNEARLIKNSLGVNVSINSSWYDGPISYSKNDSVLFFSNTSEGFVHGRMGIYWSKELPDGSFTDPQAFPLNSSEYSCMHPFFDEKTSELYFVSDFSNDSTGFDLYKMKFDGALFTDLDTLDKLNSSFNEVFPAVSGDMLYFASDRINGAGGFDLYKSEKDIPVLLGAPFNSPQDDFAIIFSNSNRGYFSSNRANGDDDIYEFYIPSLVVDSDFTTSVNPLIKDLEELLESFDVESTEAILLRATLEKLKEQQVLIEELKRQISIQQADAMNYVDTTTTLTFEEKITFYQTVIENKGIKDADRSDIRDEILADIILTSKEISEKVNATVYQEQEFVDKQIKAFVDQQPKEIGLLNEIIEHYSFSDSVISELIAVTYPIEFYFDFDRYELNESQLEKLRKLIKSVSSHNGTVTVEGHTDNKGPEWYNMRLSKRRAKFVTDRLIEEGFDPERITVIGRGELEPKATNERSDGRALNRRVVVRL